MIAPKLGSPAPLAPTPQGSIRGRVIETPDGLVHEYSGVPYGIVSRRFLRSSPPAPSNNVVDAVSPGSIAFQSATSEHPASRMSEATCLNLTVWNGAPGETGLPVFVWVHGGSHISGSNAQVVQRGDRLAASGRMIVVSINYRLGIFGHAPLAQLLGDDYADADNLAILDIIDALVWVRESISGFGGDPENVTLAGQSAGGVLVACVLASPLAIGLVTRGIIHSANVDRPAPRDTSVTDEFLRELQITRSPDKLLTLPAGDLIAAQERLIGKRSSGQRVAPALFRPTIGTRVLPLPPVEAVARGGARDVDLIVGNNANEATSFVDVTEPDSPALRDELSALLAETSSADDRVEQYLHELSANRTTTVSIAEALESLLSAKVYGTPTRRLLEARSQSPAATYGYLFTWAGVDALWARRSGHSVELPFVFRHLDDSPEAIAEVGTNAPTSLRDDMSARWAAFAATGVAGPSWEEFGRSRSLYQFG